MAERVTAYLVVYDGAGGAFPRISKARLVIVVA